MGRHLALIAALLAGGALAVGAASAHRLPKAPKCPILPSSNHFNKRVDKLPVASNSDTMIASIGRQDAAHADFGSGTYDGGPIGIPDLSGLGKQARVVARALKQLRRAAGRQRLALVLLGRARQTLEQRRSAHARQARGIGLRGRRHLQAAQARLIER